MEPFPKRLCLTGARGPLDPYLLGAQASRVRRGVGRSRCTALTRLCLNGVYVMLLAPLRLAPGFAPTRQDPFKKARVGATTPAYILR